MRGISLCGGGLLLLAAVPVGWLIATGCGTSSVQDHRSPTSPAPTQPAEPAAVSAAPAPQAAPGAAPEAETLPAPSAAEATPEQPPREGTLDEVVELLAAARGTPVELGSETASIAHCVPLSFRDSPEAPPASRQRELREAIESARLLVEESGDALLVRTDPAVLYLGCPAKSPPPPPAPRELEAVRASIRRISANERELPRAAMGKLGRLAGRSPRHPRAVPYYREQRMLGVKLYGIGPESIPAWLGLSEGDVITHLAGEQLSVPGRAIEIPPAGEELIVRVLRNGEPLELRYKLLAQ